MGSDKGHWIVRLLWLTDDTKGDQRMRDLLNGKILLNLNVTRGSVRVLDPIFSFNGVRIIPK